MKKIFRLAIVFAVAGAALLTGCTKDYATEIADLQQKVNDLSAQVSALDDEIKAGSVITNVTSTGDGILIELSNGKSYTITNGKDGKDGVDGTNGKDGANGTNGTNGTNGKDGKDGTVWTIGEDGFWYQDGVKTDYKALGKDGVDGNYWTIEEVEGELCFVEYDGATGKATGKTQKVFPEGQGGAITAVWTDGSLILYNVEGAEGNTVTISLKAALSSIVVQPDFYWGGVEAVNYDFAGGNYGTVKNTADGTDDEGAAFKVAAKNELVAGTTAYNLGSVSTARYAVNPEAYKLTDATWSLYGEDILYKTKATKWSVDFKGIEAGTKNIANVKFTITNANELNNGENISVITLQGVDNNKTVESDKAAVVARKLAFKALAFSNSYKAVDCTLTKDELYATAEDAAVAAPSVEIKYNGGAHIINYIDVHYTEDGESTEYSKSLAAILEEYPDLDATFELVNYTLGTNVTPESAYGVITSTDGWAFQPAYPTSATASTVVPKGDDSLEGISTVGKKPIVLVTLHQKGNADNVVLAGYYKIIIKKDVAEAVYADAILKDFGTLPYICADNVKSTTWIDMSYSLLESFVKMDYKQFHDAYTCDGETYIKGANGFTKTTDYGTVVFGKDTGVGAVNDVFTVTVTKANADNILKAPYNGTITLYAKFTSGLSEIYIGFTVAIGDRPTATFGTKIPVYWFTDVEATKNNTVRNNVRVPIVWLEGDPRNDDVTDYTKDLNDNYEGKKVQVEVSTQLDKEPTITWLFSATQPIINETRWTVSSDKKTLSYNSKDVVTINDTTGVIKYLCDTTSMYLLNLWNHKEESLEKILYCNVDIIASYEDGDCKIELGREEIHVRFLRPVSFTSNDDAKLKDGMPTGDYIYLGALFNATDWQGYNIFKQKTDGTYVPCYYPDEDDESTALVNWYGYYGFKTLTVDIENVMTDQTGSIELLREVNPAAIYNVGKIGDPKTAVTPVIDITDITNLESYVFFYFNNMGVVADFNLYIPIVVSYAWGDYTETITVPVTRTY